MFKKGKYECEYKLKLKSKVDVDPVPSFPEQGTR